MAGGPVPGEDRVVSTTGGARWRPAVTLLLCAAVLTAFSETFYWYSGGTDYPGRVAFYLLPTTALGWVLTRWPASGWPAVVYGGFPFDPFAISYTSLGWHALVTVGFGLVGLHRILARGSAVRAVALIASFGAFWGWWAVTLRLPAGADDEPPGLAALVGSVSLGAFAAYTVTATAAVGAAHLLLGRLGRPADLATGRRWRILIAVVGAVFLALLVVPAAPWAPVELVVLLLGWAALLAALAHLG